MDKKIAQKWYDALVSGDYIQTQSVLRRNIPWNKEDSLNLRNGYCCLGVLSEQICSMPEIVPTGWEYDKETGAWINPGVIAFVGSIPHKVKEVIGLEFGSETAYVTMNDTDGKNFSEIAEAIKNEFLGEDREDVNS